MTTVWLDFKELRERLDFAAVLKHYGVELKVKKGDQHQGFCPLPTHQGQKRSPSFSANLKRGIFNCFSCHATGNVIDFTARMEGLDPAKGADVRKAALLLSERFGYTEVQKKPESGNGSEKKVAQENAEQAATCPAIVNAPLDFTLRVDSLHPYLKKRGFTPETILHFGVGYCSRGSLQGRIAIPLHDSAGKLVGYAGRLVDDTEINEENPKYKFPGSRERDGKRYEFQKSLFLYNGFCVEDNVSDLVVVEGFVSVWWLWQHGYPNVGALMGSSCSDEQAKLVVQKVTRNGRIWLMTDGDSAGDHCAESVLKLVSPHRFVHWVRLKDGEQPTDCSADELLALLRLPDSEGGDDASV